MTREPGFAPPIGRLGRTPKNLRKDIGDLRDVVVDSDLDLHIARLAALHPELNLRFHNDDLASLDEATKVVLLEDIYRVLGVRPLKKRKS